MRSLLLALVGASRARGVKGSRIVPGLVVLRQSNRRSHPQRHPSTDHESHVECAATGRAAQPASPPPSPASPPPSPASPPPSPASSPHASLASSMYLNRMNRTALSLVYAPRYYSVLAGSPTDGRLSSTGAELIYCTGNPSIEYLLAPGFGYLTCAGVTDYLFGPALQQDYVTHTLDTDGTTAIPWTGSQASFLSTVLEANCPTTCQVYKPECTPPSPPPSPPSPPASPPVQSGCTNPAAENYVATATTDDGSCYIAGVTVLGCMDPRAATTSRLRPCLQLTIMEMCVALTTAVISLLVFPGGVSRSTAKAWWWNP